MTMQAPSMLVNVVQLVNEGDTDFNMKYGPLDRLRIPAGASTFVTEEVAWHFLGRWWLDNSNPRTRDRVAEYSRLRVLYGCYDDEMMWQANKPKLVAYTPDGTRITTVVDDPDGATPSAQSTPLARAQSLESQVDFLSRQLNALQQKLDTQHRVDSAEESPMPSADMPTRPSPGTPGVGVMGTPLTPPAPIPGMPGVVVNRAGEPVKIPDAVVQAEQAFDDAAPPRPAIIAEPHPNAPKPEDIADDVTVDTPSFPRVGAAHSSDA